MTENINLVFTEDGSVQRFDSFINIKIGFLKGENHDDEIAYFMETDPEIFVDKDENLLPEINLMIGAIVEHLGKAGIKKTLRTRQDNADENESDYDFEDEE